MLESVEGTPVMSQGGSDALPFKVTYYDWRGDKMLIERRLATPAALATELVNRAWNEGGGDALIEFNHRNQYGKNFVEFRSARLDIIGKDAGIRELIDALTPA